MQKKEIVLFQSKSDCCGCGACLNSCPKDAISMKADAYGNVFPEIDGELCIQCGKCVGVCNYQRNTEGQLPAEVYAAAAKEEEILKNSASGGVFAVLAKKVLDQSGVVFGCAAEYSEKNGISTHHIMVEKQSELRKLQGSKYVKSDMGLCYREILKQLKIGKMVLFSGTPCQVDGLKGFLGGKQYDNLITVDVICHGVPGEKLFQDYLAEEEKRLGMRICSFDFRSKENGWGSFAFVEHCQTGNGEACKQTKFARCSSYYWLFLKGASYRDNCYSCKYAGRHRFSDLTIGDFWGIEEMHSDYLKDGKLDIKKGVSCILVNSEKGQSFLRQCQGEMTLLESSFDAAAKANGQLNAPTKCHESRGAVMELYRQEGYSAVDKWYQKHLGVKYYLYKIWDRLPEMWRAGIKKTVKKIKG